MRKKKTRKEKKTHINNIHDNSSLNNVRMIHYCNKPTNSSCSYMENCLPMVVSLQRMTIIKNKAQLKHADK